MCTHIYTHIDDLYLILHWKSAKIIQQLSLLEMRLNKMVLLIWHQIFRLWFKSFGTLSKKIPLIGKKKESFKWFEFNFSINWKDLEEQYPNNPVKNNCTAKDYTIWISVLCIENTHIYTYFHGKILRFLRLKDDSNESVSISHVHYCLIFWKAKKLYKFSLVFRKSGCIVRNKNIALKTMPTKMHI